MRLISQYDISRLFQDKVENIIKEYADSYGIKINSEKQSTNNTQNINLNVIQNPSSSSGKPQILNNIAAPENAEIPKNVNSTPAVDLNGSQNLDLNGKKRQFLFFIFLCMKISLMFLKSFIEKEQNHSYSKDDSRDKDKKKRKR